MQRRRIDSSEPPENRRGCKAKPLLAAVLILLAAAVSAGTAFARTASIVIEANSGEVLRSLNPDMQVYPASLTKMMTLYLAFERIDAGRLGLEQRITVSEHAASQPPTGLGLVTGQTIAVRDAILGLVTKSANDVAAALAEALAGSEAAFAQAMTRKARALGMSRTVFRNASGLPDHDQVTTARDMAMLGQALLRDFPHHYHYFSTLQFSYGGASLHNHNRLLGVYRGMDGIKTGYIRASGFNLVASAERDGVRLVGVVIGGRTTAERNEYMVQLLDRGFADVRSTRTEMAAADPVGGSARVPTRVTSRGTTPVVRQAKARVAIVKPAMGTPASPSKRDAGRREKESGRWTIQVGAFTSRAPARDAAQHAIRLLPKLLSDTEIQVSAQANKRGKRLFRARLAGLNEQQARQACASLGKRKMECVVIPPSAETNVALSDAGG